MSKSHYIYINSKNRNSGEKIYNFNVYLKNPIVVNKNQGINCSVVGFSMLNTDYNCKGLFFKINIFQNEEPFNFIQTINYNIPDGNYNYISLMELLNSLLVGKIRIEYVKHRNCYKYFNLTTDKTINIQPFNANNILGIHGDLLTIETYGINGTYINLTNYSHIIIKSNQLDFEDNTQDNIDMGGLRSSSILFMIDKQDIPPFSLISYRNFDNGDNFSYNITNRQINIIDLHLYNEKGDLLTDTDDYFLTLKISIFNKENNDVSIPYLEDIKFLLMSMMFNNKKKILL